MILFIKIGGDSGLTFILPFLTFIFLLALGEDYNILVMSRIREEAHHLPLREAVSRALASRRAAPCRFHDREQFGTHSTGFCSRS